MSRRFSMENGSRPVMFAGAVGLLVVAAGLSSAFDGPEDDYSSSTEVRKERGGTTIDLGRGDYGDLMERDHSDFTKIEIRGGMAMRISRGDFKVEVAVEDDDQDWVETSIDGDTLIIDADDDRWDDRDVMVVISMPTFGGLDVKGAVDAEIMDVRSDSVEIDLRGAGNIEMEGSCGTIELDIRGAGNVLAEDLKCDTANVAVRGAGNAEVYAGNSVKAVLAGIGNIEVYGKPENVDKSVRGLGEIDVH